MRFQRRSGSECLAVGQRRPKSAAITHALTRATQVSTKFFNNVYVY